MCGRGREVCPGIVGSHLTSAIRLRQSHRSCGLRGLNASRLASGLLESGSSWSDIPHSNRGILSTSVGREVVAASAIILIAIVVMVLLAADVSIFGVAQLVSSIPANLSGHPVPFFIESWCILFIHVSVDVVLLGVVTDSLFDNFATLTVKHSLVGHFLVTGCLVVIHLVSLSDSLAIGTVSSFRLCLVYFTHRLSIRSHFRYIAVRLHLKVTVTTRRHVVQHSRTHFLHHLVNAAETHHLAHASFPVEEGIVLERVTHAHEAAAKTFEHVVSHLAHLSVHLVCSVEHIGAFVAERL